MELKKYIKESQMTQAQFASELDVTPIAVSRYCNGARVPAAKVMMRIVAVTKGRVKPNDFYEVAEAENGGVGLGM